MGEPRSTNVRWHAGAVTRAQREAVRGHRGAALWFTGLSGSGKSTIAHGVEAALVARGVSVYVLDGDNLRHGLNGDLGFSPTDRQENVRRIGEVARLFVDAGMIVLCAFISPYRADRARVRARMEPGDYLELHVSASIETCRARDPKGLYAGAASGDVHEMTGVAAPYEDPESPDLVLDTEVHPVAHHVHRVIALLEARGLLSLHSAPE